MPPSVIIRLVNRLAELQAWGRAADGWWGLVSWPVYGRGADGILGDLFCSAWMPAAELQASTRSTELPGYRQLLRLDLPADTTVWPVPAARLNQTWHHYGRLEEPPGPIPGFRPVGPQPAPQAGHGRRLRGRAERRGPAG